MRIQRAGVIAVLPLALQTHAAPSPVLLPGAISPNCTSALSIGLADCDTPLSKFNRRVSITEDQVNQYLAQYGKPPREAVRALLDPTDSNIAALIRKQRHVISVATYVASRMTEMQSSMEADFPGVSMVSPSQLAALFQMRVTLYLGSDDEPSLRAVRSLQQLVLRYPSIEGRLVQLVHSDRAEAPTWLKRVDSLLPVSVLKSDTVTSESLPMLLVEDLRSGINRTFDATDVTSDYIHDQLLNLREGEVARRAPAK